MSKGPWKKYRHVKIIAGVDGRAGYVIPRKRVYKDSRNVCCIFVPSIFAEKYFTVVLLKEDGPIDPNDVFGSEKEVNVFDGYEIAG